MKISINRERCTGVGLCEELDPEVFIVDNRVDGLVRFRKLGASAVCNDCENPLIDRVSLSIDVPSGHEEYVREAARMCPCEAILVEEDGGAPATLNI